MQARAHAIVELALPLPPRRIYKGAVSVHPVILPSPDVVGSILPLVLSLPMKLVVTPISVVDVSPHELKQAWNREGGRQIGW